MDNTSFISGYMKIDSKVDIVYLIDCFYMHEKYEHVRYIAYSGWHNKDHKRILAALGCCIKSNDRKFCPCNKRDLIALGLTTLLKSETAQTLSTQCSNPRTT